MRRLALVALVLCLTSACTSDDGAASGSAETIQAESTTSSTGERVAAPSAGSTTSSLPNEPELDEVSVRLTEVVSGLDSPVALAFPPGDDTMYVAEQYRGVRAISQGVIIEPLLVDLTDRLPDANEQGVLGLAFSPSGDHLYVSFTERSGRRDPVEDLPVGDTRVVAYEFLDDSIDPVSEREILALEQPCAGHNGGNVLFGPDAYLYIGLGNGGCGGGGNAQDLTTLLGAILRIDPTPDGSVPYEIPADNPFVAFEDVSHEIWHFGLRNPWRFSFDRYTGDLWIGDVGELSWEEIDVAKAGEAAVNWGWNYKEGSHEGQGRAPSDVRDPIYEYPHTEGVAVIGGFVYRGEAIPALRGAYVYADSAIGDLIAIVNEDGVAAEVRSLGVNGGNVTSFAEDDQGELYVVDRRGSIYRLDPA